MRQKPDQVTEQVRQPLGALQPFLPASSYRYIRLRASLQGNWPRHSTVIDDGTTEVKETLAPSVRVIRRVVSDSVTQVVTEDLIYGYSGSSDSPSYSRPTSGGAITTYITGPGGLLVTDVAGTPTFPLLNALGDVVGSTDAGAYAAAPATDEFGVGTVPETRLGWLGGHERFYTGTDPDLIRMGVRLYEPRLGRFLEVDPVEGGSANDYDYANSDSANNLDLDGLACRRLKRGDRARALDYLSDAVCPPNGYKTDTVKTRRGPRRVKSGGDACSWTPRWRERSTYGLTNACRTHDYGSALARSGRVSQRDVDAIFMDDMRAVCDNYGFFRRSRCLSIASNRYIGVTIAP